jgi:hypothetical protein
MGVLQEYGGLAYDGMDIEDGAQSDAERPQEIKRDSPDSPSWQKRYAYAIPHQVQMVVCIHKIGFDKF